MGGEVVVGSTPVLLVAVLVAVISVAVAILVGMVAGFSGGAVDAALLLRPKVLILDEPTTALDVLSQRAILQILKRIQRELGLTMLFITHDLALIAEIADRVGVMYAGHVGGGRFAARRLPAHASPIHAGAD